MPATTPAQWIGFGALVLAVIAAMAGSFWLLLALVSTSCGC
jgi:hypothetical protein